MNAQAQGAVLKVAVGLAAAKAGEHKGGSLIFDSALYDVLTGGIDFANDSFRVMLVGPSYIADKAGDSKRSDVAGEIIGAGYSAGGGGGRGIGQSDRGPDRNLARRRGMGGRDVFGRGRGLLPRARVRFGGQESGGIPAGMEM